MSGTVRKFIGDKRFYRRALTVALPIMLQNTVTNFVSLLDNIMVGQTGTASMSRTWRRFLRAMSPCLIVRRNCPPGRRN